MTEPRKERCKTCRFWKTGHCYRQAPRPSTPNEISAALREIPSGTPLEQNTFGVWGSMRTFWPNTEIDDWCGQWQQKDTEQHRTRPVYVTDIMATFTKYCGARYLLRKLSKEIPIAADVQRSDVDRLGAKQWSKVRDQVWQAIQAALGKQ